MTLVRVEPLHGKRVRLRPAQRPQGPAWEAYLQACAAGGAYLDQILRVQVATYARAQDVVKSLERGAFTVEVHPDVVTEIERERGLAQDAADEARKNVDSILKDGYALWPFQREGAAWLATRTAGILGDAMGVGKSVQAVAAAPVMAPVLVVCPKIAYGTWIKHFGWRCGFDVYPLVGRDGFSWPLRGEVCIANYEILPTLEALREGELGKTSPDGLVVIVDEAHYVKGLSSKRTQKVTELRKLALARGGRFWMLTGTPLKNHPPDLYALIQVCGLESETWPTADSFNEAFGNVAGTNDAWTDDVDGSVPDILRRVMLRREKAQVLPDLPEKRWEHVEVPIPADVKKIADEAVIALTALGVNLEEVVELSQLTAKMGSIPFELLSRARAALAAAKLDALLEMVGSIEEQQSFAVDEVGLPVVTNPILVWCCHRAPIDAFKDRSGWGIVTGGASDYVKRKALEDAFQRGEHRGLALTIGAGGVAITLTRASHAIFVDLPWTPADLEQAEDRVHRAGQTRGCLYTYLVADHKLDRWLVRLIGHKQKIEAASVRAASVSAEPIRVGPTSISSSATTGTASDSRRPSRPHEFALEAWIQTDASGLAKALRKQLTTQGGLTDSQWAAVRKRSGS